ncbi:MAG: hypothetical protein MUC97_19540 [Bernardetiaceae bacterium]|jgi:hypothetical protein|nr:hypothetical protein [Bernardetiaceae bacterium]
MRTSILILRSFFLSFLLLACNKANNLEETVTDFSFRETAKREMSTVSEAIRYSIKLNLTGSNQKLNAMQFHKDMNVFMEAKKGDEYRVQSLKNASIPIWNPKKKSIDEYLSTSPCSDQVKSHLKHIYSSLFTVAKDYQSGESRNIDSFDHKKVAQLYINKFIEIEDNISKDNSLSMQEKMALFSATSFIIANMHALVDLAISLAENLDNSADKAISIDRIECWLCQAANFVVNVVVTTIAVVTVVAVVAVVAAAVVSLGPMTWGAAYAGIVTGINVGVTSVAATIAAVVDGSYICVLPNDGRAC